jgi:hypothetical protein
MGYFNFNIKIIVDVIIKTNLIIGKFIDSYLMKRVFLNCRISFHYILNDEDFHELLNKWIPYDSLTIQNVYECIFEAPPPFQKV